MRGSVAAYKGIQTQGHYACARAWFAKARARLRRWERRPHLPLR